MQKLYNIVLKATQFCVNLAPTEGYALDTEFRVACSGWSDQDLPLSYKFAYKTSDEDFEQLIYFGSKSKTPPVKLPLGKANLNYSVQVIVDTADSFLAPFVSILSVKVGYPRLFAGWKHKTSPLNFLTILSTGLTIHRMDNCTYENESQN